MMHLDRDGFIGLATGRMVTTMGDIDTAASVFTGGRPTTINLAEVARRFRPAARRYHPWVFDLVLPPAGIPVEEWPARYAQCVGHLPKTIALPDSARECFKTALLLDMMRGRSTRS